MDKFGDELRRRVLDLLEAIDDSTKRTPALKTARVTNFVSDLEQAVANYDRAQPDSAEGGADADQR